MKKKLLSFISAMMCASLIFGTTTTAMAGAVDHKIVSEKAIGDEVEYTVKYYFQNVDGSFITRTVKKTGIEGMTVVVAPEKNDLQNISLDEYKAPESQSFKLTENSLVEFYYYRWISAEIQYFAGENYHSSDKTSIKGIDGETYKAPLINIDGFVKPAEKSITLSVSGNNVVQYYYTEIPSTYYVVNYVGYDPVKKEDVIFYHEKFEDAKAGQSVTPQIYTTKELEQKRKSQLEKEGVNTKNMVFDFSCYDVPAAKITETVKGNGATVIEYYYNKMRSYYQVKHYLANPDGGYKLDEKASTKLVGKTASEVTPEVLKYDNYVSPKAQTVKISINDDTVVEYYYELIKMPEAEKGHVSKQNNIEYTVTDTKNYTVSVKGVGNTGNVAIPATVKIREKDYKVTQIADNAFASSKITGVTIPDSVQVIGKNAFSGCAKLKNITIPKSVTSIGAGAFKNCSVMTKVTFKTSSLKTIGNSAFENCKKLKSITIPKNVTKIGSKAFSGCKALSKVTFKGTKVKSIGKNAFKGIKKKATFKVPKAKKKVYKKMLSKKSVGYVKTWKIK